MTLLQKTVRVATILVMAATSVTAQTTPPHSASNVPDVRAQESRGTTNPVVVVTGARFSYELVEKWIDQYRDVNPNVQIVVEARGSADPLKYDILAEVYRHPDEIKKNREYLYVGRYAILPVANSKSAFAKVYSDKGLNKDLINRIFFDDIFVDRDKQKEISAPFTVYTRLQKAGVPTVFAEYFDHGQKDIRGSAIAGADAHLIKAMLHDSTGITYLPLPLIYNSKTRRPIEGLTVLPVDVNGNKKVSEEEKFYDNLDSVIDMLESTHTRDIENIPVEYLHLSVDAKHTSREAIEFLKWVKENGSGSLREYGYLQPDASRSNANTFSNLISEQQQSN